MGKVLVLGGAGYIGSHTVYALLEEGFEVVVVDNFSTGFRKAVHKEANLYEGDIRDENFLDTVFKKEKIESVIHFAAFSQVGESMKKPLKYYDNNLYGTEILIKSMLKNGVENIVFSSTAAVYGEPEKTPITEKTKTNPTNCYGQTKLAMEHMFKWVSLAERLKFVSLRYFNACGAHPSGKIGENHNPETHLIPLVLQVALKKRPYIKIFGTDYDTKDGTAIRDYVHVLDLSKAHILAMNYLKNGGNSDVFNLGSGVGFSVKQIVKTAEKITETTIATKNENKREGDPKILVASFDKAKKILNWSPSFSNIDYIIKSAFNYHKEA